MKTSAVVLAAAAALVATAARASPFEQPSFDAADRPEIKIQLEAERGGGEREVFGPALDITLPVRPHLETSFTFGRLHESDHGETRNGLSDFESHRSSLTI